VVGETFYRRPHVDYIFTSAPDQLQVKNRNQEITKTEIGWAQAVDFNAFMETIETNREAAMDFAEKRLRRNSNQAELLKYYAGRGTEDERGRIEAFLRSGLDRRPVDIPWHRAYQTVAELNKHKKEIVSLYDDYLSADPSNASLLYLRGRIDPDWEKQESFHRRAIEADPKLGWPWLAIAARASSGAHWDDSLEAALKARALRVDEPERIAESLHEARMARGEAKSLVGEYRADTDANVRDLSAILFLIDALAASGRESEIDPAIGAWTMRLPGPVQAQIGPHLRALGLYYAGNLRECADFCNSSALVKSAPTHLHALVALGRMEEATDDSVFGSLWGDPLNLLAVSVGFRLEGKPEDSARWRAKAVSVFNKVGGATDVAKAAKFLGAPEPPSIEEVRQVYFPPASKAVILAALADQFPARREVYLAEAARFNISRKPSYHLIRRAIEERTPGHP
jgi:hypothetical protein